MKLTTLLLTISAASVFAGNTYSQVTLLNLNLENATVKDILSSIEDQSEFYFMYSEKIIDVGREVSLNIKNEKIDEVLTSLFAGTNVDYTIKDRIIVLATPEVMGNAYLLLLQQKTVIGTVTDENGDPLPGVMIMQKGSTRGTTTNTDGTFTLNDISADAILVFSFVGMQTQEVVVGDQSTINLIMLYDAIGLNEVISVGYVTKKRRDLTGSISSVSSQEIGKSNSESFVQSLQGRVSGVYVKSNSGQPGGGVSVRVRGIGGLNNSEPLYVIDGVQVVGSQSEDFNPLTSLNPNDIETIEVLKDASSAAIYGARGANGVVIINTRRGGTDGKPKLSYSGNFGIQSLMNAGNFSVLNAREYAEVVNATATASGGDPVFGGPNTTLYPVDLFPSPASLGSGTDWVKEVYRNAPTKEHQLSVSGGNTKNQYYLSINYLNQEGIAKSTSFDRVNIRLNTDNQISKSFKIGNSFGLTNSNSVTLGAVNRKDEGGILSRTLFYAPTIPIFNADGSYAGPPNAFYTPERTPISRIDNVDRNAKRTGFSGNVYAQLDILKELVFKSNFGFGLSNSRSDNFTPTFNEGIVSSLITNVNQNYSESSSYQWSNVLTYNLKLKNHKFSALAGIEALEDKYSTLTGNATFTDNAIKIVTSAGSKTSNLSQFVGASSLLSYFGNISYNYRSKYYLESSIRRDGSSRFGENNRWGVFPSASVAWRVTEEDFFHVPFINNMKIRASYGMVGNDKIGDYAYIAGVKNVLYAFGGIDGKFSNGQAIDALGNPDLKWETSKQKNIGVDLSMFDSKWSLAAEYFKTDVEDMLLGVPVPATSGISSSTSEIYLATLTANAGSLTNSGFEFETSYNSKIGVVGYNIGANLTTYKNEVTNIGDNQQIWGAGIQGMNVSRTVVGGNMGEFYGYVVDGIFQTQTEVDAANNLGDPAVPYQNAGTAPGDFKFKDINKDNVINDKDREVIGSPVPKFSYGMNLDVTYKNFDLSMLWYGVQGIDIYNANRMDLEASGRTNFNKSKTVLKAWDGPGTSNTIPRRIGTDPNQNKRVSSVFVEDGSFLALRNVRLSYNISGSLYSKLHLSGASVYVSAQNLFVFTRYSAFDPEIGNINGNNLGAGIDNDFYPRAKTIYLGLNINF